MTDWYSATDLEGVPGMAKNARNIRLRATKEGWQSRPKAKGKGLEYHIASLPYETKAHLSAAKLNSNLPASEMEVIAKATVNQLNAKEKLIQQTRTKAKANSIVAFNNLNDKNQQRAKARMQIVQALEVFIKPFKEAKQTTQGEQKFCAMYNSSSIDMPKWVYETVAEISWQSCRRWKKQLEEQGIARLAGNYLHQGKPNKIELQPDMKDFLVAIITAKPHLASKPNVLQRMLEDKYAAFPHWDLPSASSVGRWLSKWKEDNSSAFAYVTNPDKYNSQFRPLFGTMYNWITEPNDVWELDSTPTDVMLNDNGRLVRYSVIGAIDVQTRRVKLLLAPTSNSEGICLLLRKCLLEWGLPNEKGVVRTDNGTDYVSERVTAVFQMLGIEQSRARPFSGWEKPFIERFFKTMSHAFLELLPGYIGHCVADRKQIDAAKAFAERIGEGKKKTKEEAISLALTPIELEQLINDWVEHDYHHRAHDGLNGKTPFQAYLESAYSPKNIAEPHSLDLLLNYVGTATVLRGRVSAGSVKYTAPELMEPNWNRKRVRVFLDPTDVGRATLYPLDDWGVFVEAVNTSLVGNEIEPAQFREKRKEHTKTLNAFRKASKKLQEDFGIETHAAETLAAKKAANTLAQFSHRGEISDNKAISALSEAVEQQKQSKKAYSDQELAALEQARAAIERREQDLNNKKGKVIRNLHDKAQMIAEQSLTRDLTEIEQEFLTKYMRENRLFKKAIQEILARRRQA
ncbi:DNA-binding protein [Motilimonas sp. 1_MG-2023]|uniref:DNA-binding protein n=1 Tax=Motilimonas sp. 1_MG-2023 TaxID=3062672 RepID=UPI0026E41121|nr:DNA-binding protein [Motilimonas sp. 1_MG-2023]MDO6528093.1 DNA-binding protein [Motilimonas sp. 1_MG-2023]